MASRSVGHDRAEAAGTGAVDDACDEEALSDAPARGQRVANGSDEVELVAAIPGRGDAGGKANGAPFHLRVMPMHVPQAGNEVFFVTV